MVVAHCGDIVNFGFENPTGTYNPIQYEEYKRIRDLHPNLPIYAASGNHDQPVPTYIDKYMECTGHDIRFTVEHDNDVFIFLGQPKVTTLYEDGSTTPVPELAWLETQLANNADVPWLGGSCRQRQRVCKGHQRGFRLFSGCV